MFYSEDTISHSAICWTVCKYVDHCLFGYINTKAKCRHLKKLPMKRLCGRCLFFWGPEPHTPPPPYTHCIRVYSILIHTGKGREGGRAESERRLEGEQFTKLGRKYQHDWLYLQSTNSLEVTKFCLGVYIFKLVHDVEYRLDSRRSCLEFHPQREKN
jgi:hypothetical protein